MESELSDTLPIDENSHVSPLSLEVESAYGTADPQEAKLNVESILEDFPQFLQQSQELLEQWRHERTVTGIHFTHIGSVSGNMVAGQGNIHQFGLREGNNASNLRVGRVLYSELAKLKKVFLSHELCETAKGMLDTMPLLFLRGHARLGKSSAALYLLSSRSESVYELDPTHHLEAWLEYSFQPNYGYWLNVNTADAVQGWTPFLLQQLCEHLRVNGSRLIITLDTKVPLATHTTSTFLLPWEPPTDLAILLHRHLQWYADVQESQVAELLATTEIKALLSRALLPGEIDQLARLLADVLQQKMTLAEALEHFDARAEQLVSAWFANHLDPKERTFLLTVATLHGAPLAAVQRAYQRLEALLFPNKDGNSDVNPNPYGTSLIDRLQSMGAELKTSTVFTDFGRMPVKTIHLRNLDFQQAVLPYVWSEYDQLVRGPLRQWLDEMAHSPELELRIRIAAAVGSIARHEEFVDIVNTMIRSWAKDPNGRTRAVAALALSFPAWDSLTAPAVLNLLRHWSSLPHCHLNHTALLAWGGWVGQRYIDFACDNLYLIARHEHSDLMLPWVHALLMLFDGGQTTPEHYFILLPVLSRWMTDKASRFVQLLSMTAFDAIASESRPSASTEDAPHLWHTLLWLAAQNTDMANLLATMWRTVLRDSQFRRIGLGTLRRWIVAHDSSANSKISYRTLKRLLHQVMAEGLDSDRRRIYFYLDRWAQARPTSVTTIRLYQELFRH